MNKKILVFVAAAVVIITAFVGGTYIFQQEQREQYSFLASENNEVFVRDHSPRYGNSEAKVFLIEYLDPECESCRAFYPEVKKMLKEFDGKVQLVVRYAPFHKNSQVAVRALEAARMQGKYWEALELLFQNQPQWGDHHNPRPELIFQYLSQLEIDMELLKKDMLSQKVEGILKQDVEDLKTLDVRRTPSFFVNGKPLENFGVEPLRDLIQNEVKKAYP